MEMGTNTPVPKKGYWSQPDVLEKHAKNRRERYNSDPKVAAAEKARQRKIYREKLGKEFKNPARDALACIDEGSEYSATQLSIMIGRAPQFVNRLIGRGLWPDPRPEGNTTQQPCFPGRVARRLIEAFATHIDDVSHHYRADHVETTKALFAAMKEEG